MSLWKVAWRSIRQRSLVSLLTVLSMGLGVALVVGVLVVYSVVEHSFQQGGEGYDLIVGAKGGREQLVLNTVFYMNQPVGNIPYLTYEHLIEGKFGRVETAIPVCMGHTYQGFRIIGTVPEMFTELKYHGDQPYKFASGHNMEAENANDAVLGSIAAYRTHLTVGEKFRAVQGVGYGGRVMKDDFNVVGVLAPTGTPVDRAVFVNMLGFKNIYGAEDDEETADTGKESKEKKAEPAKSDDYFNYADHIKEVTAVLVCLQKQWADSGGTDVTTKLINSTKDAQAVAPARVIAELFEGIIGKLQWVLLGMAVLTVIEAGIGIMVSIYNSMSDRRHEIAIMRALGASRLTVMVVILLESILLSLMGGVMGMIIGHGAIWICSPMIADWTGVVVGIWQFDWRELILIPGLIVLASAVGYLPAMAAYRTDVAKSLVTTP